MKYHEFLSVRSATIVLVASISGAALADSEWPPFANEVRQEFVTHKHLLESVEDRMQSESVTELHVRGTWEVSLSRIVDGELQFEEPEDHDPWVDDLFPLRIDNVKLTGAGYRFSRAKPLIEGDTVFDVIYFHGTMTGLHACSASFATADCGYCGVTSDDGWITVYHWTPPELSIRNTDFLDEPDIEEASARFNRKFSACMNEGLAEIASLAEAAPEKPE